MQCQASRNYKTFVEYTHQVRLAAMHCKHWQDGLYSGWKPCVIVQYLTIMPSWSNFGVKRVFSVTTDFAKGKLALEKEHHGGMLKLTYWGLGSTYSLHDSGTKVPNAWKVRGLSHATSTIKTKQKLAGIFFIFILRVIVMKKSLNNLSQGNSVGLFGPKTLNLFFLLNRCHFSWYAF